jgi:hypothetical protein
MLPTAPIIGRRIITRRLIAEPPARARSGPRWVRVTAVPHPAQVQAVHRAALRRVLRQARPAPAVPPVRHRAAARRVHRRRAVHPVPVLRPAVPAVDAVHLNTWQVLVIVPGSWCRMSAGNSAAMSAAGVRPAARMSRE